MHRIWCGEENYDGVSKNPEFKPKKLPEIEARSWKINLQ
jgi:hypothetical protein